MLLLSPFLRPLVHNTEYRHACSMHNLNPQKVSSTGTGVNFCLIKDKFFNLLRQLHAYKIAKLLYSVVACLTGPMPTRWQHRYRSLAMQTAAAKLRARIQDVDAGLSRVSKAYLQRLTDWQEHGSITSSLTHSMQVSTCDL